MIMKKIKNLVYQFHTASTLCGSDIAYYTIFAAHREPQNEIFSHKMSRKRLAARNPLG